jgi:hypothetical protein
MIILEEYVGIHKDSPDWTPERQSNAKKLLAACETLQDYMETDGIEFPINPKTGSEVSGETFGGFRPQNCPIGASNSSHKEGLAVDRYDPKGEIDSWCMANQIKLKDNGIFIEHPSATPGWSHWTIRPPGSGHTVFYP